MFIMNDEIPIMYNEILEKKFKRIITVRVYTHLLTVIFSFNLKKYEKPMSLKD